MRAFILVSVLAALLATAAGGASRPHLRLPYDLAARGSTVYVADGLRHQILRFDLKRRLLVVVAGTGKTGTSGDGGPARKARLTEPAEITLDPAGNRVALHGRRGRRRPPRPRPRPRGRPCRGPRRPRHRAAGRDPVPRERRPGRPAPGRREVAPGWPAGKGGRLTPRGPLRTSGSAQHHSSVRRALTPKGGVRRLVNGRTR